MTVSRRTFLALMLLAPAGCAPPAARGPTPRPVTAATLHDQAVRESLAPIRQGSPGVQPFWNGNARQFITAPAFEFPHVDGAARYHFTVAASDSSTRTFDAPEASAPLKPVWKDLPPGPTTVKVEALNDRGNVIGAAGTRSFHRAAVFNGPYGAHLLPYEDSARVALASVIHEPFVQSWWTTGQPDPSYPLYRYTSKIIGSLMSGCAIYARQSPRPGDADAALEIGRRAADFLIGISAAPGTPLEYMPPTYQGAKPTERENDNWTMLMSPAEAGQGYLDLYDVIHDARYLDAADRIARTYGKLQRADGTWPLKVDNRTGQSIADVDLIPSVVISFLDRLVEQYGKREHKPTLARAARWVMENPVRTMNWQAQFDDAKLRGAYQNLSKHEACEFAGYLFRHANDDPRNVALAEELVRWAEDQFVTWEHPPQIDPRGGDARLAPDNWFTPCSLEQYAMFEPISGSSAFMIMAYVRAYDATGKPLYLAKAESLANALEAAQQYHHGRYPTRMIRQDLAYWINSSINTVRAMEMLGRECGERARAQRPHEARKVSS